jgi:hypothetical protein
VAH